MTLSKKQKIILWVTVILIVIFLGLHTKKFSYNFYALYWYGIDIGRGTIGLYKYQMAIATLLIGFALLMTGKK